MSAFPCPARIVFLALLAVGITAGDRSGAAGDAPDKDRPISGDKELAVSIAIPLHANGERVVDYGATDPKFQVLVTNISAHPLRIWEASNSWGSDALSFDMTGPDGKTRHVEKGPEVFTRNGPGYHTLPPHESLVLDVHFADNTIWSRTHFPKPTAGPETATMRAIFEIYPTEESKKYGVWTGRIVSTPEKYTFYSGK